MLAVTHKTTLSILLFISILAAAALVPGLARRASAGQEEEARVTSASLKADDARPAGPCPVTVNFSGYIKTAGPGTVKYTFTRSDGATAPVSTLFFKEAGTQ